MGGTIKECNSFCEAIEDFWRRHIEELNIPNGGSVVIFGCGVWGKGLCSFVLKHGLLHIQGLSDNNSEIWGNEIEGITVAQPEKCVQQFGNAVFIISIEHRVKGIYEQLLELKVPSDHIRILNVSDYGNVIRKMLNKYLGGHFSIDSSYPSEDRIPVVKKADSEDKRDFRIYIEDGLEQTLDAGHNPFTDMIMDDYEKSYGRYRSINDFPAEKMGNTTAKIMIACSHKDFSPLKEEESAFYVPVQVGRALTDEDRYPICDNTGEHISDRNYNYCECSALYWAWKNGFAKDCDYTGLRHYRRTFDITDMQLSNLKENGIDILHVDPIYHDDIRFSFLTHTKKPEDWDLMKEVIKNQFPDYYDTFTEYENQHFICAYNMSVMRRDIFDEYCEFLFGVLVTIEDHYLKIYDRRDRYLGFLAENLTSIFFMHKKDKYNCAVVKLVPDVK